MIAKMGMKRAMREGMRRWRKDCKRIALRGLLGRRAAEACNDWIESGDGSANENCEVAVRRIESGSGSSHSLRREEVD